MKAIIRIAPAIAALALAVLLITSCGSASNSVPNGDESVANGARVSHAQTDRRADVTDQFSIYDLESEWMDQQGLAVKLRYLAGRPRVIALVYTSCANACPRILKDMKHIEGELRTAGIDAGFMMVSIDPARDTPERLHEYARSTLLDPNDWTLLTGTDDGVLELAALLGVRYRRTGDSDFDHSNVITLLDADGRIVHRQVGLGAEPGALVQAAATLNRP